MAFNGKFFKKCLIRICSFCSNKITAFLLSKSWEPDSRSLVIYLASFYDPNSILCFAPSNQQVQVQIQGLTSREWGSPFTTGFKLAFNHLKFYATGLFNTPWKHQKTRGFLMFSRGIQKTSSIKQLNIGQTVTKQNFKSKAILLFKPLWC